MRASAPASGSGPSWWSRARPCSGWPGKHALMAGAALECVHCYSLVHDDLPAMDNDDLRRGQPTVHKAFDDATAILAGDGLLTFAFDILARPETHPNPAVRVELVLALARASGLGGMVGGQMLDLAAEGRFADGSAQRLQEGEVATLAGDEDRRVAQIRLPCRRHPRPGDARTQRDALDRYGAAVGQAFQIADDLLDVEGDPALVGKQTGKDAAAGKATMVGILGTDGAKARLRELVDGAEEALAPFGAAADVLHRGREIRRRPSRLADDDQGVPLLSAWRTRRIAASRTWWSPTPAAARCACVTRRSP